MMATKMTKNKTGIFLFTNDLRLHDNPALIQANALVDELLCIYIIDFDWRCNNRYSNHRQNSPANLFLRDALYDLDSNLRKLGQRLIVVESDTVSFINHLIEALNVSDVFRSDNAGYYENNKWRSLIDQNHSATFHSIDSHTLFSLEDLPFSLSELPTSFTKFKNSVRDIHYSKPIAPIEHLLKPVDINLPDGITLTEPKQLEKFKGGETQGLVHLEAYFSSEKPASYKEVRNALDGWDNSCKLSPWLANGCLSVRQVMSVLVDYEQNKTANESTYWIYFELLWREYFQWYAHKNGVKLFAPAGIKKITPLTSYYPERFQKWVNGSTPYPIVNACMNELLETGYLSNRGRQITASCFVNELAMDWRYGAAYFEQVLIDYDVASNWGNWQYLAGVGADTRDKRHFNLEKQTQQFDPENRYIKRWNGDVNLLQLDSVDAADWPIE